MQGLVQLSFEYLQEWRFHSLSGEDNSNEYHPVWGLFSYYFTNISLTASCTGEGRKANRNLCKKRPVYSSLWPLINPSPSSIFCFLGWTSQVFSHRLSRSLLASSCSSLCYTREPKTKNSTLVCSLKCQIQGNNPCVTCKEIYFLTDTALSDSFSPLLHTADSCSACPVGPSL